MNADSIKIECEDDGFYIALELDENLEEGTYRVFARIAEPEAFYDHVKAAIGPWLHERELARRTLPVEFACDPDESAGYDISDPKHEGWHSLHADLWDSRDKTA